MTTISTEQFDRARQLALRLAGIELFDRHRGILDTRSRRLGIGDSTAIEALLDAADRGDEAASRQLVGLLTTNFTGFFRHPHHFSAAAQHALGVARDRGSARVWSAAASTGEEPYSLAIALIDAFGVPDPPVTIFASDIDDDALEVARAAEYGELALSTIDGQCRRKHFEPSADSSGWLVTADVRRLVEIRRVNLIDEDWPDGGPFDVIFSRNVLMYLEAGHREKVARRMASRLSPGGLLVLDPAEHLGQVGSLFTRRAAGIFTLRESARTPLEHTRVA